MSTSTVALSRRAAFLGRAADYAELTRPKIAVLIVATAAVARLAAGGPYPAFALLSTVAGVLLVAASASALNQWLERKTDALMARTAERPIPSGRLGGLEVLCFALVSLVVGEVWLAAFAGWGPTLWAAATWAAYVCIYTPLKSRTWFNTVVGAVAGAMPVFIGWSAAPAAPNPLTDPLALALFGLVFLWQFPHFMAIAWIYRGDYADAGLRMLTVTEPTGRRAGQLAIGAAIAVMAVSLSPLLMDAVVVEAFAANGQAFRFDGAAQLAGWEGFGWLCAGVLGAGQLACAMAFAACHSDRAARRLLHASLIYLPAILTLFLLLT